MQESPVKTRPSLRLSRSYIATPEKLWRAWTDAQALAHWFRPDPAFAVTVVEIDVREGGSYRIVMRAPDGEDHDVRGVYREVVRNEKLVFTWAWASTPERESLVTVTLRPAGAGTELTLLHEQFADTEARDRHQEGWNGCLAQLARSVA